MTNHYNDSRIDNRKPPHWFIVDAHLDLAYNALGWKRDYRRAARWTRYQERGTRAAREAGQCSVGLPDLIRGRVGIVFGTIFMEPSSRRLGDSPISYRDETEAHAQGMAQLEFYHRWADKDEHVRLIGSRKDLDGVLAAWSIGLKDPQEAASGRLESIARSNIHDHQPHVLGVVPLMEGADPILEPKELELWVERGLRIVGPAWTATRYAGGTHEPGGLTKLGYELLEMIAELGLILDVSHLAQEALFQALDRFEGGPGKLIATHSNPQKIIPTDRHLPDAAIELIAERRGVIGVVLFNRFLNRNWGTGSRKHEVALDDVVRAIDYICQLTGSSDCVGIGSDFDGGFGSEAAPRELDTSRDLYRIGDVLYQRGYSLDDVEKIMSGNWLRILKNALP